MSITLLEGDCLEVMKDLSDNSVDLFICDLPYGQLTTNQNSNFCNWDIKINLEEFWKEVQRLKKNKNTPIIHFCNTKFGFELIESKKDWFRYDLVWNKERGVSFLSANRMPLKAHEMIYVFSEEGAYYNRIDIEGEYPGTKRGKGKVQSKVYSILQKDFIDTTPTSTTHRCAISVINMKKKILEGRHPTEKPTELYKWLIERYCPPNGTLLDPTAGSFNSCFAGFELDRNCIGIEKNSQFYQKACQKADTL